MSYLTKDTRQNERNFNQITNCMKANQTCSIAGEIHVVNGLEFRVEVFSIFTRLIFYDTYVLLVQDATIYNVV